MSKVALAVDARTAVPAIASEAASAIRVRRRFISPSCPSWRPILSDPSKRRNGREKPAHQERRLPGPSSLNPTQAVTKGGPQSHGNAAKLSLRKYPVGFPRTAHCVSEHVLYVVKS